MHELASAFETSGIGRTPSRCGCERRGRVRLDYFAGVVGLFGRPVRQGDLNPCGTAGIARNRGCERRTSPRIQFAGCPRPTSAAGALRHGSNLAALAGDHGLGVPLGARGPRVRGGPAARSRPVPRVGEHRVHRRRRLDQRGRPARAVAEVVLPRRDQEPPRNRGGRPGHVDLAARRAPADGRQPAAARESQGEEADLPPASTAGATEEGGESVPGSPRVPVARGRRLPPHGGPARAGASTRYRNGTRRVPRDRRGSHPAQRWHAAPLAARRADGQGDQPRHAGSRHSPVAALQAGGRLPARRAHLRRAGLPGLDGPSRRHRESARVRIYAIPPAASDEEREALQRAARREYHVLLDVRHEGPGAWSCRECGCRPSAAPQRSR